MLDAHACTRANGFLEQTNIATVINLVDRVLNVVVEYRDLLGVIKGQISAKIDPNLKQDFIVNELGLEPDSYGMVCVTTDAEGPGAWTGGVTLYKPKTQRGETLAGFDFALYFPFTNPRDGVETVSLNTFHFGTDQAATVANWVQISDAVAGDGHGLDGTILYYNDQGEVVSADVVEIPDGGAFDYSGHEGIGGPENNDAVGMGRFVPEPLPGGDSPNYYITAARYFYDAVGAAHPDFLTAFTLPRRPGISNPIMGGVSTKNGEISIVELNNITSELVDTDLSIYSDQGVSLSDMNVEVPALATRHIIVGGIGEESILADDMVGSALATSAPGYISASTFFYKLGADDRLEYAYAAPMVGPPGDAQLSEFNSFLTHSNDGEIYNFTTEELTGTLDVLNFDGGKLFGLDFTIAPKGTIRTPLIVPQDTYGSIIIQGSSPGLVFRNYVNREEYTLPFLGGPLGQLEQ